MFQPEFPAEQTAARRRPPREAPLRDAAREELVALIASELLFLAALLVVARM